MSEEVARWAALEKAAYAALYDDKGLLNEFAMMWALRARFPLHYIVFRQTTSHLPHEGNVEQLFSRSGLLTDPNMDPHFLANLTRISVNKSIYKPPLEAIKDAYYTRFRGRGAEGCETADSDASGDSRGTSASHASA